MSSNVEKLLKARLADTAGVTALVSTRIYPVAAPQDATYPYLVYSRSATEFIHNATAYSGTASASISVTSWAETYSGSKALADQVRAAFDGWSDSGSSPEIDLSMITNEFDVILSPEDGSELPFLYGVQQDLDISFEE